MLAMGMTRGWRTPPARRRVGCCRGHGGRGGLRHPAPSRGALQLVIGTLLLIFGLQWLRKAILRAAGSRPCTTRTRLRDQIGLRRPRRCGPGLDWFGFIVAFKGVLLEGLEVVFIVVTFGISAGNMPARRRSAPVLALVPVTLGIVVRGPRPRSREQLKYGVGLLLTTFGTFWAIEGLGLSPPAARA